ncbi:protein kinase domain-containing protein [Bifidobacterium aquikefiricola]|uniref:non-specific serine/threonine protein kinase n=1 Tax=Bifidobacterium aquikefiricola TaxID=3059038 RepID=A0AB39U993_9BIFI
MSEEPYPSEHRAIKGTVIDGRYRIIRKIAEGGMATVFEAIDERLSRHVALKMMHMQLIQGAHREQFIERFQREARSSASIANPHIVQVYDTGTWDGVGFLVMEYVHGVNLRYEMNQQGTFSVHETLRILSEILDGLSSAHMAGVVHRDVKPENILINDRGHVQITDFGLAKAASQATLSTTGMLLGTAAYLAPEMIEFNEAVAQGDVYACGIIAYEMLTGAVPFVGDNPVTLIFKHVHSDIEPLSETCPGIDAAVSQFISRLASRQVTDRPKTAQEAFEELQELSASLSAQAQHFQMPARQSSQKPVNQLANQQNRQPALQAPPAQPKDDTALLALDSHTSVLSATGDTPTAHVTQAMPSRSRFRLIAGIVALLLILGASGTSAWWYFLGPGSYLSLPMPTDVSCPANQGCTVKGASWTRYKDMLHQIGIKFSESEEFSDSMPKGSIVSGRPDTVGSHISKRGGSASFVISKGIRQATIPQDILDATTAHGKSPLDALKSAGFSNVKHDANADEYSIDVPEHAAISVVPAPGTTTNHNTSITVVLSKGPKPVSMPNIVGLTKDAAQHQLDEAQLKSSFTQDWSDSVDSGKVISSSEEAGAQLHWGDAVSVVISKGPQMVTVPDVRGKNENDASSILKALGLDVKISAPLGDLTQTVRLQDPDPGQQIRIRDTSGKPTVITLTVV